MADTLPQVRATDRLALVRDITAGHLSGIALGGLDPSRLRVVCVASFASGYHALFLAGALFMLVSTALTWRLVSPSDTPPGPGAVTCADRVCASLLSDD